MSGQKKNEMPEFFAAFVIKIGETNVKMNEVDQIGI
jgi:hypothetical protein